MTFNPAAYTKTAAQTWEDKVAYDKFISDNKHLAMPFHIDGLQSIVPDQYPGELAVYVGKPHSGKSTALRDAAFLAQKRIESKPGFVVGMVSLEDTSETTAAKQSKKYQDPVQYQDDQFIFVGNSFKMGMGDMAQLNVDNIVASLDYGLGQFAESFQYSAIFIDYAQVIPPVEALRHADRREQVRYDVMTLFHASKHFMCPIGLASQALIKQQRDNYTSGMKIPGAADLKEASELYEIPDIVYAYWQPKHDYPIGSRVDDGNWSFEVTSDLGFLRIVKRRNAELLGYVGDKNIIGRVFPFWFRKDSSMYYDADKHRHMYLKKIDE